jgi:hypothetical protein
MSDENPLISEIKRAAKPRINVSLPPRGDLPDEAVAARAQQLGEKWGSNTQLGTKPIEQPTIPMAPLVSLRFDCPDYTDRALSVAAAEQNVTKTYLLLLALRQAGYPVEDVDLAKDRRRQKASKR